MHFCPFFVFHLTPESEEFGPVFIQEPDDAIFSLDSDDKKVIMNCEARGNPVPTYRYGLLISLSWIRFY